MSYKSNVMSLKDVDLIDRDPKGLIKEAPHYLIFAFNARWDGANGYKFVHSREDIFYRTYDCSTYPAQASDYGKILVTTEYSHDVPQGYTVVNVALTEREYSKLLAADFDDVETFAEDAKRNIA